MTPAGQIDMATRFLGALREALDAGAELPDAIARSAAVLPLDTRDRVRTALRRLSGDYDEDEWGFDEEFVRMVEPAFEFLYDRWWRVRTEGVDNVPARGRAVRTRAL